MKTVRGRVSTTPPPDEWAVPLKMRGMACMLCGHLFQDGETHGELDLLTGEAICTARVLRIGNRPSLALVRQ